MRERQRGERKERMKDESLHLLVPSLMNRARPRLGIGEDPSRPPMQVAESQLPKVSHGVSKGSRGRDLELLFVLMIRFRDSKWDTGVLTGVLTTRSHTCLTTFHQQQFRSSANRFPAA